MTTPISTPISHLHGKTIQQTPSFQFFQGTHLRVMVYGLLLVAVTEQASSQHPYTTTAFYQILHLISEISTLYGDMAPSMLASDHAIFDYPLAECQKHSTTSPILKCSIKDMSEIASKSKLIYAYFSPHFLIPPKLWNIIHPSIVNHFNLEPDCAGSNSQRLHSNIIPLSPFSLSSLLVTYVSRSRCGICH
jgi:hypothetical protein